MSEKEMTIEEAMQLIHGAQDTTDVDSDPVQSALVRVERSAQNESSTAIAGTPHILEVAPHVEQVLLTIRSEADQMLSAQRAEAEEILVAARQKAHAIVRDARLEADKIVADRLERIAENIDVVYAYSQQIADCADDPQKAYALIEKFVAELVKASKKVAGN